MKKLVIGRFNTHQKLKRKTYERDEYTCQLNLVPACAGNMRVEYERWKEGKITRRRLRITVDHRIPISKGGKWEMGNLQTACRACNTKKGSEVHSP